MKVVSASSSTLLKADDFFFLWALFIWSIEPHSLPMSLAKEVTSFPAAIPVLIAPKAAMAVLIGSMTCASS
jgi:hypothetical protein